MCSQPSRPTVPWAASPAMWPADRGRGFCPSAPLWQDLPGSPASSSGALGTGETWTCWSGLFSPEKRRLWGHLIAAFQYLKGAYNKDWGKLFSRACCDRTRGNAFKLKEGRFRLDIRKNFCTISLVGHWHRLPREVVDAPSLETSRPGWTGL